MYPQKGDFSTKIAILGSPSTKWNSKLPSDIVKQPKKLGKHSQNTFESIKKGLVLMLLVLFSLGAFEKILSENVALTGLCVPSERRFFDKNRHFGGVLQQNESQTCPQIS